MDNKIKKKIIWLDCLCWQSFFKIFQLKKSFSIKKVYYAQASRLILPFFSLLQKRLEAPLIMINDLSESDERIGDESLYEVIQCQLTSLLEEWVNQEDLKLNLLEFCQQKGFNWVKVKEHLKENTYFYLFRVVELCVIAKHARQENTVLMLRNTPLSLFLTKQNHFPQICFYHSWSLQGKLIQKRKDYHYDQLISQTYHTSHVIAVFQAVFSWLLISLNALVSFLDKRIKHVNENPKIGLELSQKEIRLDRMNDVYWLKDSRINPQSVCGLEMEPFDDESLKVCKDMGISRYKVSRDILRWVYFHLKNLTARYPTHIVSVDIHFVYKTFTSFASLFPYLFSHHEKAWVHFQMNNYRIRSVFWHSIYKKLGIRLLWSMYDVDADKLAKAEAIEQCCGLYTGGHWSNFPMYRVDNQKCYDVLFTWGKHFIENNFSQYPFMAIFPTGYPCDHYFKIYLGKAAMLRRQYTSKFILSYMDNIMANDLPYSKLMQVQIHQLLCDLLRQHDRLTVFLKPKRRFIFEKVLSQVPELKRFMDKDRVRVFFGPTAKTKTVPAYIGMASDLVIGLGISTTAAECYFAGTVSFHADLSGFRSNAFANKGEGKVVFRDIDSLRTAIEERITGGNIMSHEDYRPYYECLDPYQDGQAYKRMGFIMKRLQEGLKEGLSREETVDRVQMEFKDHIHHQLKFEEALHK